MLTGEDLGHGAAAFLARVPIVKECGNAVEPAMHVDITAGGDGDNRMRIGLRDCFNQLILSKGKFVAAIEALAF